MYDSAVVVHTMKAHGEWS